MTNTVLTGIHGMQLIGGLLSYNNSSSAHFKKSESDIWMVSSSVKTDIYRISQCGSTGNIKINKTVSVFKDLTVYC